MSFFRQFKEVFFKSRLSNFEKQMLERIDAADTIELRQMYSDLEKMQQRGTISEKGYAKMKARLEERLYL
ncbi:MULTISPECIES: hypothetical protein [Terrabacteria group]|uniref:hypothetical protein n=1 Tax=Bacillati TaxID=1783272 RepID=UPI001939A527|nr:MULTISPECIES: hypothetical protein [Terrabacteria group]MBW9212050.1 hypothetical protein [Trueperella sp. zg.1013]QRG87143.1 hypothetical protein JOS54_02210 [Bulleidia sp. zg-1006]